VQSGELAVVGVNRHVVPPEDDTFLRDVAEERFAPDLEHVERIRRWRPTRDTARVREALDGVGEAARRPDADLMAPVVAALDADATIGEITGSLREGRGLPADPLAFAAARSAGTARA
jgi:methylmalonyl-CoA mutase N-terminal domain/subunit